jgi:hypothetical protein
VEGSSHMWVPWVEPPLPPYGVFTPRDAVKFKNIFYVNSHLDKLFVK